MLNKSIIMDLTQEQWAERIENDPQAVILDVRTRDEWDGGHIPNATLLDIYQPEEFLAGVEKLDPSKHYYVYCKGGTRSAQACSIMSQMGIPESYNLLGGFSNWKGNVAN